jgi:hypothetical protein
VCGIAGFYLKDPDVVRNHEAMEKFADCLLLGIEDRGKRATGLVAHTPGGHDVVFTKGAIKASDFIEVRDRLPKGARTVLLHTRFDTQGDPKDNDNNHPVIFKSTFVTHNGAIYNDDDLWKGKEKDRKGLVDSSAIALALSQTGLEQPEKALESLDGPMAIASIDPIEHPDLLLLARGYSSPLIVHESDKFIVWASTTKAIRDAWKTVLGTPPHWDTFQIIPEGKLLLVSPDGIKEKEFDAYSPPVKTVYHSSATRDEAVRNGRNCSVVSGNDTGFNRISMPSARGGGTQHPEMYGKHKDAVRALRAEGKGKARVWEDWHTGLISIPADLPRKWSYCKSCLTPVLEADIQETLAWGDVCCDCYAVAVSNQPHQQNPADILDEDDKRVMENWASLEANVHRDALAEVAQETLLDVDTIDFLIFRVPKEYTDEQPKIAKLSEELDILYQIALEEAWSGFGVKDAGTLRYFASQDSDDAQPSHYDEQPLFGQRGSSQESGGTDENENTWSDSKPSRHRLLSLARTPDLSIKGCVVCKHRTRFHMMKWAWCRKHYIGCTNPGCTLSEDTKNTKYPVKAICTSPDGRRLCHHCSRGEKGLIYDSEHEDLRVFVAERTNE